jgi:hypothetical protein
MKAQNIDPAVFFLTVILPLEETSYQMHAAFVIAVTLR